MNINLRASLKYKFQTGTYKGRTLKSVIDENEQYIDNLKEYGKIKLDVEALEYLINKKNEKLQHLSGFCYLARGNNDEE